MIIPSHGLIAGFTGSRNGITSFQRQNLTRLLSLGKPRMLHHGDCLGADCEAHMLCLALGIPLHGHPPDRDIFRAFCSGFAETEDPAPYLARDRDIARACDYLIACPGDYSPRARSGTWYTVKYAGQARKPVWLLFPDGSLRVDRPGCYG